MRAIFFSIFFFCSNLIIGQTISDITFHVDEKEKGEVVIKIEEGDQFTLEISTGMSLEYTKSGKEAKWYRCDSKKNKLTYMSYTIGDEKHEFNLIEGVSPRFGGSKNYYSLLLEKVYESEDIALYFSPIFMFEEYNPLSKYNSDTVKYLAQDHYLIYGEDELMSKTDGTVSSLAMRLGFAACNCTVRRTSKECEQKILDKFPKNRKVLPKEEMIEIINFWENNCTLK